MRVEVEVHGDELVKHIVEGATVLEYTKPQIGGGNVAPVDPAVKVDGTPMTGGYISIQAETAPVEFRKIELLNLEGLHGSEVVELQGLLRQGQPADVPVTRGLRIAVAGAAVVPPESRERDRAFDRAG